MVETLTEILVDISGSMRDKMVATKQVILNDILPKLDYSSKIGIKTFSTTGKEKKLSIIPILPLSNTDKEVIEQKVKAISCSDGYTPIAASIRASVEELSTYPSKDKVIILVTDGEESENGNYVLEAQRATEKGINCKIHVVGIDLKEKAILQAHEISKITGGVPSFITLPNNGYNQQQVRASLSNFYTAVNLTSNLQQTNPIIQISSPTPNQAKEVKDQTEPKIDEKRNDELTPKQMGVAETSLEVIAEEIKELRKEIAALTKEKKDVPEPDENPVENERIRKASEEYLYDVLKRKYPERVKWLNEDGESYSDHDFEVLDFDGKTIEYFIECKGTKDKKPTFYLTKNEWRLFTNNTKNYQIYFVKSVFDNPFYVFIDNVLDWLIRGRLLPYLKQREIVKEERVCLTIHETSFDK